MSRLTGMSITKSATTRLLSMSAISVVVLQSPCSTGMRNNWHATVAALPSHGLASRIFANEDQVGWRLGCPSSHASRWLGISGRCMYDKPLIHSPKLPTHQYSKILDCWKSKSNLQSNPIVGDTTGCKFGGTYLLSGTAYPSLGSVPCRYGPAIFSSMIEACPPGLFITG